MGEKVSELGFNIAQMMQMQQAMMQQLNLIMASLGIELRLEKIDLEPRDDPNSIDFIWRLKCSDPNVARILKNEFVKQFGGEE